MAQHSVILSKLSPNFHAMRHSPKHIPTFDTINGGMRLGRRNKFNLNSLLLFFYFKMKLKKKKERSSMCIICCELSAGRV